MSDLDLTVSDEWSENGAPYISKSRLKTFKTCPRSYYFKYICGNREPTNYYMKRGSQVHRAYENFHLNLSEYIKQNGQRPHRFASLMSDWEDFSQWLEPHIGNFWRFEERRWETAHDKVEQAVETIPGDPGVDVEYTTLQSWEPVAVEAEAWLGEPPESWVEDRGEPDYVSGEPPVGDAPWMGFADVILNTASVPGVTGSGVVILDYKTGKVPDKQYREDGIFLEGEYYGMLFEEFFDVDGVAGYYPKADELIVSPYPSTDRQRDIKSAVLGMQKLASKDNYEINENPLCHYGHGKCFFYDECESTWGTASGAGYHDKAEDDESVNWEKKNAAMAQG
jgi:hypothetical protein